MYTVETYETPAMIAQACVNNKLDFSAEEVSRATSLVWKGSSFNDSGPDYNVFNLMVGDTVLASRRIDGY